VTGGALSLSRSFNGYGEVQGQDFTVGGQGVTSWSLTRDDSGRIRTKTETVAGASSTYAYTYDPMGRLRTVTRDGALVKEYQYDPVTGIRSYEMNTLRGISGRSYTYSNEDHLLSAGATTYQYSLDGFLTNKTNGANQTSYVYSSRGELLRVDPPDGRVIEYVHDPLGRRIAKKVNGAITEKYLWQGLTRLLAIYDGSDSLLMRFQYADARMPVAMTRGGTTYYLTYDQVGSLRAVADASGNVVKRIDYDSFGIIINDSDPSFAVPFGFAGGLHDRDTGLVRFGFRDYDSDVGRWLAKDPIGFLGGGADLYAYCLSDPVNLVDPLGRGVRGAAMGAAVGMAVGVVLGTGETALTGGLGVVAAPAIVAASAATFALAGHLGEELGLAIGGALDDLLTKASLANPCAKQHSPDRRALNELIDEVTQGGRRPLSESDADAVLDWADELGIQGARDDRATDHWEKGPHIHVPGSGISHIPAR
jgi:RHS repeat-associated protein